MQDRWVDAVGLGQEMARERCDRQQQPVGSVFFLQMREAAAVQNEFESLVVPLEMEHGRSTQD